MFIDQLRVKLHKSETKDQVGKGGQLQGQRLNLAGMQLNWFLKSKLQLRTWLIKSKIKDWFGLWHIWCRFHLNETARFSQNGAVSSTVHKKKRKARNSAILNDTVDFLLLDVQRNKGRELRSPVFSSPFLPPFSSKGRRPKTSFMLSWPVASHVLDKRRRRASSGSRGATA